LLKHALHCRPALQVSALCGARDQYARLSKRLLGKFLPDELPLLEFAAARDPRVPAALLRAARGPASHLPRLIFASELLAKLAQQSDSAAAVAAAVANAAPSTLDALADRMGATSLVSEPGEPPPDPVLIDPTWRLICLTLACCTAQRSPFAAAAIGRRRTLLRALLLATNVRACWGDAATAAEPGVEMTAALWAALLKEAPDAVLSALSSRPPGSRRDDDLVWELQLQMEAAARAGKGEVCAGQVLARLGGEVCAGCGKTPADGCGRLLSCGGCKPGRSAAKFCSVACELCLQGREWGGWGAARLHVPDRASRNH